MLKKNDNSLKPAEFNLYNWLIKLAGILGCIALLRVLWTFTAGYVTLSERLVTALFLAFLILIGVTFCIQAITPRITAAIRQQNQPGKYKPKNWRTL